MNDDELERRGETIRTGGDRDERPAVVAYDPYFPARAVSDEPRVVAYDPHFPKDGASDFE